MTFLRQEIAPLALDPEMGERFSWDIWRKVAQFGLLGAFISKEFGGLGLDLVSTVLAFEEVAKVNPGLALSVGAHNCFAGLTISEKGAKSQKEKYLPKLAKGDWVGAGGWTEPNAGSDVHGIQTKAVRQKDGYVLNGTKTLITNAPIADVAVILAVTNPTSRPPGQTTFVLEGDFRGFSRGEDLEKLGFGSSPTGELFFEDCRVPLENRLGEENAGFTILTETFERGRIGYGAICLGMARACLELAVKRLREKMSSGKSFIGLQAASFKVADMKTNIEAARLLIYRATWLKDRGESAEFEASMAKLFSSEISIQAAAETMRIYETHGLLRENLVERYMRDSLLNTIGEGTSEIQRLIIARQILREEGPI
ncbi:MAG: acyl-CoA dehydrogenase [Proteobacteria bacterium]|nr:acyl-CoA dehydrogenase [Pseudomonadota bacterium]